MHNDRAVDPSELKACTSPDALAAVIHFSRRSKTVAHLDFYAEKNKRIALQPVDWGDKDTPDPLYVVLDRVRVRLEIPGLHGLFRNIFLTTRDGPVYLRGTSASWFWNQCSHRRR
jgi:hypothetical protein